LRVILAEREMKQKDVADKIGISGATMSALVNGRQIPTLDVAYRVAEELGLSVHDIWIKETIELE
jgi:DNA-binding XRE family transcriptional regulator